MKSFFNFLFLLIPLTIVSMEKQVCPSAPKRSRALSRININGHIQTTKSFPSLVALSALSVRKTLGSYSNAEREKFELELADAPQDLIITLYNINRKDLKNDKNFKACKNLRDENLYLIKQKSMFKNLSDQFDTIK